MTNDLKSLYEVLGHDDEKQELYTTDQKKRYWRAQKGQYSKTKGLFNFLNLIKNWEEIVGKMMANNTIPLKIRSKTLIISTKHAVFAQELSFLAPEILKKVKSKYPELESKLENIKFIHSSFSAKEYNLSSPLKESVAKPREKKTLHPYSPQYKERKFKAEQYFKNIEDPEVKELLINFMMENG